MATLIDQGVRGIVLILAFTRAVRALAHHGADPTEGVTLLQLAVVAALAVGGYFAVIALRSMLRRRNRHRHDDEAQDA